MIASENILSPLVRKACNSDLHGRYAEGLPGKRYYQGCDDFDTIEEIGISSAKRVFDCNFANIQSTSGTVSNMAGLKALANPGDTITAVSTAGLDRYPHRDILSVAPKAAVEAVVRGIAVEEGRFGVRANSVRVGVVEAGIFLRLEEKGFDPSWIQTAKARTPLGRFGRAEEVAEAVVFLASNRAGYITGQSLTVDGGWSI